MTNDPITIKPVEGIQYGPVTTEEMLTEVRATIEQKKWWGTKTYPSGDPPAIWQRKIDVWLALEARLMAEDDRSVKLG